MRFNSPDTLSPFSTGGINSYTFALADPINNSDPTGRTSENRAFRYIGPARKIKGNITVFKTIDHESGKSTLHLSAHGLLGEYGPARRIGDSSRWYTPDELIKRLKKEGYTPKSQPINIYACYSADPPPWSSSSFIQKLAKLTGQSVIGFQGVVTSTKNHPSSQVGLTNSLGRSTYSESDYILRFFIHTTAPEPKEQSPAPFSFSPMRALPSGEMHSIRESRAENQ